MIELSNSHSQQRYRSPIKNTSGLVIYDLGV